MKTGVWIKLTDDVYPPLEKEILIGYENGVIEYGHLYCREQFADRIKYVFGGEGNITYFESQDIPATHFMLIPELKKG